MRRPDSPLALVATALLLATVAATALADAARWLADRWPWP